MDAFDDEDAPLWPTVCAVVNALYPVLVLVAIHLLWDAAWQHAGHRPHAGTSLPSGARDFMVPTMALLLASPAALLANVIFLVALRARRAFVPLLLFACLTWGCSFVLLRWDPWGAVFWFMD